MKAQALKTRGPKRPNNFTTQSDKPQVERAAQTAHAAVPPNVGVPSVRRVPCSVKFADPWCMRPKIHPLAVADLRGVRYHLTPYRQGGARAYIERDFDERHHTTLRYLQVVHLLNLRKVLRLIYRYEASGRFTKKELFLMRQTLLAGWSLRRIAAAESIKVSSISDRIHGNRHGHGGLRKKAPEFWRWWKKNVEGRLKERT